MGKPSVFLFHASFWTGRIVEKERLTASIGFSVANLDNMADSLALFSGGKKRSRMFWPLLRTLPTVPWRAPVMLPTSSAMMKGRRKKWMNWIRGVGLVKWLEGGGESCKTMIEFLT